MKSLTKYNSLEGEAKQQGETQNYEILPKTSVSDGSLNQRLVKLHKAPLIGQIIRSKGFEKDAFLEEVGRVLATTFTDLGLKEFPESEAQKRMVHYLVNYYKDFTLSEIGKAFEMAVIGELEVNLEHYGQFTPKYFCSVLNAYRKRRQKASRMVNEKPKEKELSPEEIEAIRMNFVHYCCDLYDEYCQEGGIKTVSWNYIYNLFIDYWIVEVSEQDWVHLWDEGKQAFRRGIERKVIRKKYPELVYNQLPSRHKSFRDQVLKIRVFAKKIAVKGWFAKWAKEKFDLRRFIHQKLKENEED